ncbi:hypothetical protein DL96DRAFT_1619638 [Flagelloscypha sp. PMI_526]|nr:hypothetical protein DL96DRAFT_1619638 [Flagelloscypha sp. PMI_526]
MAGRETDDGLDDFIGRSDMGFFILKGVYQVIFVTACWGFYAAIVPVALGLLRRQGIRRTTASLATFLVVIFMFAVSTIYWVILLWMHVYLVQIRVWEGDSEDGDGNGGGRGGGRSRNGDRFAGAISPILAMEIIDNWPRILNFIVGDAIVIWRAYKIGPKSQFFRGGMLVILGASAVVNIASGVVKSSQAQNLAAAMDPATGQTLDIAAVMLSFTTNLLATVTVGHAAWRTRRTSIPSFQNSSALRVLLLLTETGLIYLLLQFILLIFNALPVASGSTEDIYTSVYFGVLNILSGLFPTLVVILLSPVLRRDTNACLQQEQKQRMMAQGKLVDGDESFVVLEGGGIWVVPPLTMEKDGKLQVV